MIPKIIHYCWFGDKPMPKEQKNYIKGWKKLMPDYQFICWNEENIDVNRLPFIREAYSMRKMAFVADYTRLNVLYIMGGIYLDTDVKVIKRFDDYLHHGFFSSVEYHPKKDIINCIDEYGNRITEKESIGISIHSAIIASEPNHPFVKDCLSYYETSHFYSDMNKNKTIPTVLACNAEKYGFKYLDKNQLLESNIFIYSSDIFAEYRTCTKNSVAIHFCEGSWVEQSFLIKFQNFVKKNAFLFWLYRVLWKRSYRIKNKYLKKT